MNKVMKYGSMGSRGRDPGDGGIGPFNYPPPTIFLYMKFVRRMY